MIAKSTNADGFCSAKGSQTANNIHDAKEFQIAKKSQAVRNSQALHEPSCSKDIHVAHKYSEKGPKLVIVDYGVGNLHSLLSAFKTLKVQVEVSSDAQVIMAADRIVLPGVGAFGDAAAKLFESGLANVLDKCVERKIPLLGICLGMQLLFETSYEFGTHKGLSYLPGNVVSLEKTFLRRGITLKVPHMGWNKLDVHCADDILLQNFVQGSSVYFVHSFHVECAEEIQIATAEYGIDVCAYVHKDNVYGCQFHPEKSGQVGLGILENFVDGI